MSSQALLGKFLHYLHPALEIPPNLQKVRFSNPALSITQFQQFPLPPISPFSAGHLSMTFFSQHAPTVDDIGLISKIPVPTAKTLEELHQACKTATLLGSRSVVCPHTALAIGKHAPLWIITYWTEVINLHALHKP
jgi:hypothetical protein